MTWLPTVSQRAQVVGAVAALLAEPLADEQDAVDVLAERQRDDDRLGLGEAGEQRPLGLGRAADRRGGAGRRTPGAARAPTPSWTTSSPCSTLHVLSRAGPAAVHEQLGRAGPHHLDGVRHGGAGHVVDGRGPLCSDSLSPKSRLTAACRSVSSA